MAERTDLIEQHIELTRYQLGNNLHELVDKVKQAADWRTYYERNTMMMVGLAFGGGVMLASMLGGRRQRQDTPFHWASPEKRRLFDRGYAKRSHLRYLAKRESCFDRAYGGENSQSAGRRYSGIQRALC